MSFAKISIICVQVLVLLVVHETISAPSTISIASSGGSGAIASAGDDGGTVAMSGVPSGYYSDTNRGSGSNSGSSASLLSRTGGGGRSSQGKTQSVVVGPNGDTTILQQNGDQPIKVYKING